MTMNLRGVDFEQKLIDFNPYARPIDERTGLSKFRFVTKGGSMHWTGAYENNTPEKVINYWNSLGKVEFNHRSAHAICHNNRLVQTLLWDEFGYHQGDIAKNYTQYAKLNLGESFCTNYYQGVESDYGTPNACTFGIELIPEDIKTGKFSDSTIRTAVEIFAYLFKMFNLDPMQNLHTHHMITGKECPLWVVKNPWWLDEFRILVACRMGEY